MKFGVTGNQAFVVNRWGMVLATNNLLGPGPSYSGRRPRTRVPYGTAALTTYSMTGRLSYWNSPLPAVDGNLWYSVCDKGVLQLGVQPWPAGMWNCLFLTVCNVDTGATSVAVFVQVNHAPRPVFLGLTTIFYSGRAAISPSPPPGLAGSVLTFWAFALDAHGALIASKPLPVPVVAPG